MLIEFSVANYRSFNERQTLSMIASNKDKQLPDNLIELNVPGLKNVRLVKSVAIYGANASGKSNLFKAAEFMSNFVVNSATDLKPGAETGTIPFKLDLKSQEKPSEFEVLFIHENIRYQYGFSLNKKRVLEEWLYAYPHGQPQHWFERIWNEKEKYYKWKFGTALKGEKESLKLKTRDNGLFISTAAQFNHEQLGKIFEWFQSQFRFIDFSDDHFNPRFTTLKMQEDENFKNWLVSTIQQADFGIGDVKVKEVKPEEIDISNDIPKEIKEKLKQMMLEDEKVTKFITFNLTHNIKSSKNGVEFHHDEESAGTLKFFSLLGPWFDILKNGFTIFIDEIGAKMHPLLVRNLLKMIHNSKLSEFDSQLIFTTHDTTQLDNRFFRRDQIWFTEKNPEGATNLYPLTYYKVRNDEALQKGYLAGRYGAIPFIGEFTFE